MKKFPFFILAAVSSVLFIFPSCSRNRESRLLYPEHVMRNVRSVEINGDGREVMLVKTERGWRLRDNDVLLDCSRKRVEGFVDKLASSLIYDLAGSGLNIWSSLGVDPESAVTVKVSGDNRAFAVYYGKRIPGTSRIFVRPDGDTDVYEADYPGGMIYADKWFWVILKLFRKTVNPEDVIRIAVSRNGSEFSILRKVVDGKSIWVMNRGKGDVFLDGGKVELLINELCAYTGRYIVTDPSAENKLPLIGSISITESSGNECGLVFYGDSSTGLFVRRKEGGYLYATGTAEMKRVLISCEDVLNRF